MKSLDTQDMMDVLMIGRTALECSTIDELREQVLCLMELVFKADRSIFFLANGSGNRISHNQVTARGLDDESLDLHRQHYFKINPLLNNPDYFASAGPDYFTPTDQFRSTVCTLDQFIPFKDLTRTKFYNDFLEPQSIYYVMCILLKSGQRLLGSIGLSRPKHSVNFSHQEKTKGELLARYLAGALEKTIALNTINERECIIDSLTTESPYKGIIILDDSLDPVYVSQNARNIISPLYEKKEPQETPPCRLPEELYFRCRQLKESVGINDHSRQYQRHFELLTGSEQNILVHIRRITRGENQPLYYICLEPDDPIFDDPLLSLSHRLGELGLTRRERELVPLLYQGLKNSEISERLCICEHTVETHLRSIYEKLGVRNRTSAVHRLIQIVRPISLDPS